MESKTKVDASGYRLFTIMFFLTLIASMLPEVLFRELTGAVPVGLTLARLTVIAIAGILAMCFTCHHTAKYTLVLVVIVLAETLTKFIASSYVWQRIFDMSSFAGNFGGSILLKVIGVIPLVGILFALFKTPKAFYMVKGDLSVKADEIKWLGIKKDSISWGKLALISAVLISLGTIFLTVLTVTGSSVKMNVGNLIRYFPFVVMFALLNSLCEGIVYRSAVLGSIKNILPKNQAIFIAALLFGIGHYYGVPSGIVGVLMSGLLGWYLSRSMYETKGFASSWLIHFLQDVVIFSTILLLGNYV